MRAFGVFLKVLGNECYITGNKVYIQSYKNFLKKIVKACLEKDSKYRVFLTLLIQDEFINAYHVNLIDELMNEQ